MCDEGFGMGSWGSAPLDNDCARDFVDELMSQEAAERTSILLAVLDRAMQSHWLDFDEAAPAMAAALIVALARAPGTLIAQREQLLEIASAVDHVQSIQDFLGDLKPLRAAKTARLCLRALDHIAANSELADLGFDDAHIRTWLDDIRLGLRSPLGRWPTQKERRPRRRRIRDSWPPGTLLLINLGDEHRTYAQILGAGFIAIYDTHEPADAHPLDTAEILALPVLFSITFNDFLDCPNNWQPTAVGETEASIPLPTTFMQNLLNPQDCSLILGNWESRTPATPAECVGLERYGVAWDPASIEERIRCHYTGQFHEFTEQLKVRV
jgi:hypothetical protein